MSSPIANSVFAQDKLSIGITLPITRDNDSVVDYSE